MTPEISKVPVLQKIIAQEEDKKTSVKRKIRRSFYLTFSVEHKDVIEKTKESNVATVDLNRK
jgi:transposase